MEFLFITSHDLTADHPALKTAIAKAPRLAPIDGDLKFHSAQGAILITPATNKNTDVGNADHDNPSNNHDNAAKTDQTAASSSDDIYIWDGHGISNGSIFSSGMERAPKDRDIAAYLNTTNNPLSNSPGHHGLYAASDLNNAPNINSDPNFRNAQDFTPDCSTDTYGVFTFALFNPKTGVFCLRLDPLWQYPVFIFENNGLCMISNSVYLINAAATVLGFPLTRAIDAGAIEALFGIGANDQTGFKEIRLFPHGTMFNYNGTNWRFHPIPYRLHSDQSDRSHQSSHSSEPSAPTPSGHSNPIDNSDQSNNLDRSNISGQSDYSGQLNSSGKSNSSGQAGRPYDELLTYAAARLRAYMKALDHAGRGKDLMFDLTGGIDSRICFAAAIGAGLKNITIFAGGNASNPDKRIAHQIAERFDARHGDYPANFDPVVTSHETLANTAVFRQQGHSNLYHYDLGCNRLQSICRVRGGTGEITRLFKPSIKKKTLLGQQPLRQIKRLLSGNLIYRTLVIEYIKSLLKHRPSPGHAAFQTSQQYVMKSAALRSLFTPKFQKAATRRLYKQALDLASSAIEKQPSSIEQSMPIAGSQKTEDFPKIHKPCQAYPTAQSSLAAQAHLSEKVYPAKAMHTASKEQANRKTLAVSTTQAGEQSSTTVQSPPTTQASITPPASTERASLPKQNARSNQALSADDLSMELYIADRSKRHFGYSARMMNIHYGLFDPLCDPVLYAAAQALSPNDRAIGRLAFDLIERLGGKDLLQIPYAEQSLKPDQRTYLAERLGIKASTLTQYPETLASLPQHSTAKAHTAIIKADNTDTANGDRTDKGPNRFAKGPDNSVNPTDRRGHISSQNSGPVSPTSGQNHSLPNHLGMHGIYLWNNRKYFRKLINSLPAKHNVWDIFERSPLWDAIQDEGYFFENETSATHGLRILHTLVWASEKEHPTGIIKHFEISSADDRNSGYLENQSG